LIPQNTYEWIFGNEFGEMRELWRLIFPSIIAMSLSAVVGNLLHAQNRFVELARNHFFALVIMMASFLLMKNFEVSVKYTLLYSFDVGVVFLMIFNLLSSNIRIFNKRLWVDNTLILLRLVKIRID
jgi:peptidoglycan biosynthesis protein MviN/MurJ (putative lipid II flippase)